MKYVYEVQDSNGKVAVPNISSREQARAAKQACYSTPNLTKILGEVPPYKIVRFEKTNPTIIR